MGFPHGKKGVYWWNYNIARLRRDTCSSRRSYQRSFRRHDSQLQIQAHRATYSAKKELKIAIREAQAKSWADLCRAC